MSGRDAPSPAPPPGPSTGAIPKVPRAPPRQHELSSAALTLRPSELREREEQRVLQRSEGRVHAPATVFLCTVRQARLPLAFKEYELNCPCLTPEQYRRWPSLKRFRRRLDGQLEAVANEMSQLRWLRHENVVPLVGAFLEGSRAVLVFPYLDLGSAKDVILRHSVRGLPEAVVLCLMRDVLEALCYLHANGVIHRAVRCSHILLSKAGAVKLAGLKYAAAAEDRLPPPGSFRRHDCPNHVQETNLLWQSPEYLLQNQRGYDEGLDVYALGATACEAANGWVQEDAEALPSTVFFAQSPKWPANFGPRRPFLFDATTVPDDDSEDSQQQQQQRENGIAVPSDSGVGASVGGGGSRRRLSGQLANEPVVTKLGVKFQNPRCPFPRDRRFYQSKTPFSPAFHDFVKQCVSLEPHRPSAQQLQGHPFVRQSRKSGGVDLARLLETLTLAHLDDVDAQASLAEQQFVAMGLGRREEPTGEGAAAAAAAGDEREVEWDFPKPWEMDAEGDADSNSS